MEKKKNCDSCDADYSPLVYQAGYVTVAQHFESPSGKQCGGISFWSLEENIIEVFKTNRSPAYLNTARYAGWWSIAQPEGKMHIRKLGDIENGVQTSEKLYIEKIYPFCCSEEQGWHHPSYGLASEGCFLQRKRTVLSYIRIVINVWKGYRAVGIMIIKKMLNLVMRC